MKGFDKLTMKQARIADLMACGLSNTAIAQRLKLSPSPGQAFAQKRYRPTTFVPRTAVDHDPGQPSTRLAVAPKILRLSEAESRSLSSRKFKQSL